MKSRETDEEQPDPLDALESFAELFGFIFKDTGEEGLHNFFAVAEEHGRHQSRESLEEAADELEEIGMTKPAAILREYAKKSPRTALQIEQDKYWAACPYPRDTPKARAWSHREWEQSRQGRQGLCPW